MRSIRWRLLLSLGVVLLCAAAVSAALTWRSVLAETRTLFDYQLRQMALSLRDQGAIAPDQASALADEQLDFVVQIWSVDGRSIYASRIHPELPDRAALGLADVRVGGKLWRTYGVVTRDRVIQVAQPEQIRRDLATAAALRSVEPLAWLALPMAALVWWLVNLMTAPLRSLARGVQQRDAAALTPLALDDLPDEVAPLVSALNALLARLGDSLAAQRAFVADAAHELRSPLTALKLQLQALRSAPPGEAREAAQVALGQGIDRAARLVEQLLALARSEPGATPAEAQDLDLTALASQALADLWPQAQAKGSTLALDSEQPVPLRGDAASLSALIRNLAHNALQYSPPGAQVILHTEQQHGVSTLTVDDSGPGIPPAERDKVFDRFWRRDSGQADGSGLGLAIVQAVAQRHGAQLTLGESPLGGLRVRVRFGAHQV
jgi:signal transduction histidine kinase